MRSLLILLIYLASAVASASQIKLALLPGFSHRSQAVGVLRADAVLLLGGEMFSIGPYAAVHLQLPEQSDTIVGGAIHVGGSYYVEIQAGALHRRFFQIGTQDLSGSGVAGNLVFGSTLSPIWGLEIVVAAKRISEGTLDRRWTYNLLPMLTLRGEF